MGKKAELERQSAEYRIKRLEEIHAADLKSARYDNDSVLYKLLGAVEHLIADRDGQEEIADLKRTLSDVTREYDNYINKSMAIQCELHKTIDKMKDEIKDLKRKK